MLDNPLLNAFVTLILTVGGLGLALFLVKRYSHKINKSSNEDKMRVSGKLSLSPKTHVYILEVEGRRLLVGSNDNSISTLAELNSKDDNIPKLDPPTIETALNEQENDLSFKSFLKTAIGKQN